MITKIEIEFMEIVEDLKYYPDLPPIPSKAKEYTYTAFISGGIKVRGRVYVDVDEGLEEVVKNVEENIRNKFKKFLRKEYAYLKEEDE